MKINVSSDVNAIPERKVNTIDPKDKEKWEIEWEINHLRTEIRKDMQDYKLLYTRDYVGADNEPEYLFDIELRNDDIRLWFAQHLYREINNNLSKLQELVEQENE
jgi:hypothetical protein